VRRRILNSCGKWTTVKSTEIYINTDSAPPFSACSHAAAWKERPSGESNTSSPADQGQLGLRRGEDYAMGKRVAAHDQKLCARQTAARDCCRQQQELFVRRLSMSSWTKAARGSDREAVFGGEDCAA